MEQIDALADMIVQSNKIVVFTGAGFIPFALFDNSVKNPFILFTRWAANSSPEAALA